MSRWKVARDPYLSLVADTWGDDAVWEAGFFEDDAAEDAPLDDVGWLCTPTAKLRANLEAGGEVRPPLVLVATGGFFPLHAGHTEMLTAARAAAENAGRWVVGGYVSPAHDAYLRYKGAEPVLPASARLAAIATELAHDPWLDVDPWEAQARSVAVNYTDVTARLQAYLRANVDPEIDVWFVCGGDNARFSLAFAQRGGCVVVSRPGHDAELARWRADPRVAGRPNVCWADGTHTGSSTALRPVPMPATVPGLHLRGEPSSVAVHLGVGADGWTAVQDTLVRLLEGLLPVHRWPGPGARPPTSTHPLLSLDPATPGDADLGISRLFDLGGRTPLGHVARPGWPPLPEQFAAVPAGRWTLLDDDQATGATHRFVLDHLPPGVEVVATATALDEQRPGWEIADARDFLPGTRDGGLVVRLPDGSVGRAPYLLPYVDPATRAGIPPAHALAFSRQVWALAASTFDPTDTTVADLPGPAAATFLAAGFDPTTPMADLCRHHQRTLERIEG